MQFLADVSLICEDCNGKRFSNEILEVKYKEKNIFDILELSIEEALQFFSRLQADLPGQALACFDGNSLDTHLAAYLDAAVHRHYLPLAL